MDRTRKGFWSARRRALKLIGAAGALSLGTLLPLHGALAQGAGMPQEDEKIADTMKRLFGNRSVQEAGERLKLDAPMIAENGAVVPLKIDAELPMTKESYVKNIYVIADKNRRPMNARFALTPDAGKASVATNIRLAATSDVRVIAEMSDGALYGTKREVKVTVGGCGG